jgi:hypothetical protein
VVARRFTYLTRPGNARRRKEGAGERRRRPAEVTAGYPCTAATIDSDRFTRQHAETLPVVEPSDVQNAVALVRSMLLDDTAP